MRRLRIRTRLVLGTSVLAAIVLGIALIVARAEVSQLLESSAVSLARSDLAPFVTDLRMNPGETPDPPTHGELIVVRDASGADAINTMPHDLRFALPAASASNAVTEFRDDEGRSYVIVTAIVQGHGASWSLWAARDVSSSAASIEGIDVVFIVMGVGLLAVLIGVSWILVRRALRPVDDLRRHASALGPDELLPVGDNGDELALLAGTLNDLVGRVRSGAARERQMVSDAAHELRTPLAGLRAELELARRHPDDAAATAARLEAAQIAADRLSDLATNLLELSRLDEGADVHATSTTDEVRDAVLAAVDRARNLAAGRDIDVVDEIALRDPDARYRVTPLAVGRVLDNLCSNAQRALGDGGTLVVEAREVDGTLVLAVQDDGPGAPEDFLAVAFERFTRADESRRDHGSGLGLALVAAIAQAAGGTATVVNTQPGFRAEVRLPKM